MMRRPYILVVLALVGCGAIDFPANAPTWPALESPIWTGEPRFAITDNGSDQLSFVSADAARHELLGTYVVGDVPVALEGPHHLAASPDGRYVYFNLSNYVAGAGSGPHGAHGTGTVAGSVVKIRASTGEKVGAVLVDRSPGDVILSRDGTLAFVSHYDLLRVTAALMSPTATPESAYSTIAVVDTASMQRLAMIPVCPAAHGLGLSPDEHTLYVTCAQSDELAVVDVTRPSAPKVAKRVPVGPSPGALGQPAYAPYALAVSPSDGSVWVSNNFSNDVRVYDPVTLEMDAARTVPLGGVAMFSSFTHDGATIYVPHQGDDRITAIDTKTLAKRDLPLPAEACLNAHAFVFAPDEASAVVVCEGDHVRPGTIAFVSFPSFSVSGFVPVGIFPDGAVWLPPVP